MPDDTPAHEPSNVTWSRPVDALSTDPDRTGPYTPAGTSDAPCIAGYELLGELGRGGMGVVYHARDVRLKREVALKMVLGTGRVDSRAMIRFLAEAEAVAAVRHPHVVGVYEYGEADGRPFLALEWCQGGTLSSRLKAGRLTASATAGLVRQIAEGVAAAHAQGIVHRDLKPGNVLFDGAGRPKVADFGLAKRPDSDLTLTGAGFGTPAYMSPEQAQGEAKFVGPSADVWALGVMLYECLTGGRPFAGGNEWAIRHQVLTVDPGGPRTVAREVPRDLDLICRKCLTREPPGRYADARELADDLGRYLDGLPIRARPPGLVERGWKWVRRNKAATAVAAAVVVAAGAGGYAALARAREATEAQLRGRAEAAEARVRRLMYSAQIGLAERAMREGNEGRLAELLTEAAPAAGADDLRGFEWFHLRRFVHRPVAVLRGGERVTVVAYHPTGNWLAGGDADGRVRVWAADLRSPPRVLDGHSGPVCGLAVSPDGRWLASADTRQTVLLWDTDTWTPAKKLTCPVGPLAGAEVAFSPDGGRLVAAGGRLGGVVQTWTAPDWSPAEPLRVRSAWVGGLAVGPAGTAAVGGYGSPLSEVWDLNRRVVVATLGDGQTGHMNALAFRTDGTALATANGDGTVGVWDPATGKLGRLFRGHVGKVTAVRFGAGGDTLASGGADGTVRIWDTDTGAELAALTDPTGGAVTALAVSPAGGRLAAGCDDGGVRVWDATGRQESARVRASGPLAGVTAAGEVTASGGSAGAELFDPTGRRRHSLPHPDRVNGVALSPDASRLATACRDGGVRVWDARTGRLVRELPDAHPGGAECVAYTPDGRLVSGGRDEAVKLWDTADRPVRTLVGPTNAVRAVAVSPDGRRVAAAAEDRAVRVWDLESGQVTFQSDHADVAAGVAFGPAGELISAGWDGRAVLWDTDARAPRATFKGHAGRVLGVVVSPDGRRVATAGADGVIRVWDPAGGQELLTLRGHRGPVRGLAFRADGRRLWSAGDDQTVRAWDAPSGD